MNLCVRILTKDYIFWLTYLEAKIGHNNYNHLFFIKALAIIIQGVKVRFIGSRSLRIDWSTAGLKPSSAATRAEKEENKNNVDAIHQ